MPNSPSVFGRGIFHWVIMGQGYMKYTSENGDPARILDFFPFQAA